MTIRTNIFGLPTTFHWSFFANLAFQFGLSIYLKNDIMGLFFLILSVYVSIYLHELGHYLPLRLFGKQANGITLHAIGGLLEANDLDISSGKRVIVYCGGPVVSAGLFFMGLAVGLNVGPLNNTNQFLLFAAINLVLLVFNLIPVKPLDGGMIFEGLMEILFGTKTARSISLVVGTIVGILAMIGLYLIKFYLYMVLIGIFVVINIFMHFRKGNPIY